MNEGAKDAALCALDDVPDGGGFEAGAAILVLRRGDDAWAYRNVDTKHQGPIDGPPTT